MTNEENEHLLICTVRSARRKALAVAREEALTLLQDLGVQASAGGPLSERGAVFWITLPASSLDAVSTRLPYLGYTETVDLLIPAPPPSSRSHDSQLIRWRHRFYRLSRLYAEDTEALREQAPDRRLFLLETEDHVVREIRGYRGDGSMLGRRGLPVYDARVLVNLVVTTPHAHLLDPFAGIGGIVREALARGCTVSCTDIDPALRHGLHALGAQHQVADASQLPFADATFDAIATEPPYDPQVRATVLRACYEMARVLKPGGRLALLCTPEQAQDLRDHVADLHLHLWLDTPIDRKGLAVVLLALQKR